MVCVQYANPTGTSLRRRFHGKLIRMWANNQTETVVAIDGRGTRCRAHYLDFRFGIDSPEAEHVKVAMQPSYTMRVDAAQICAGQHIGSLHRILLWYPRMEEHSGA